MDDARFDSVIRHLGESITRRGAIGVLAGVSGLAMGDVAGKKRKRRSKKARRVSAEITDGELDGIGHPHVGLMIAQDKDRNRLWRCSGTLLSPTLFLTAGHCVADDGDEIVDRVEIWFAADLESDQDENGNPAGYPSGNAGGTPHTHPQYDPEAFYLFDLGVVVLDPPGYDPGIFGTLPTQDRLDGLAKKRGKQDQTFTAVGYGLQKSFPDAASWKDVAKKIRMVAHPRLVQINSAYTGNFSVLLSNNTNTGGTCFGDSGGPNFFGDTNVIAGVTSYSNNDTCAGTGGVYRVDRADDLNWLCTEFGLGCL